MDRSTATVTIFSTQFTVIVVVLGLLVGAAALSGTKKQLLGCFMTMAFTRLLKSFNSATLVAIFFLAA
jgi:hypothetical protein